MKMRTLLLNIILFASFILPQKLSGQGIIPQTTQDETAQVNPDSVVLRPFPATGIAKEFGTTNDLIISSDRMYLTEEQVARFASNTDTLFYQINLFLGDSTTLKLDSASNRELDEIGLRAQFFINQIALLQERLTKQAEDLESELSTFQVKKQRWQLTLEQEAEEEIAASRIDRIQRTIERIDSVGSLFQEDMVIILDEQDKLTDKRIALEVLVVKVMAQKVLLGETILSRDMPGFFKSLTGMRDANLFQFHKNAFKASVETDLTLLKAGYTRAMIIATLMLLALLGYTIWFKRNWTQVISEEYSELSGWRLSIVNSPVVSTLFVVALMIRLLIPALPMTFFGLNLVILLIAMIILMIRIYGAKYRTWIIVLVLATCSNYLYELSYHPSALIRIGLMVLSFVGVWLSFWLFRRKPYEDLIKSPALHTSIRIVIIVFLVLQFLAIIANLVGAFRLAEFLALLPMQIYVLAIVILLSTKLANTIIYLILSSKNLQKLNVVRDEFQVIHKKSVWLVDFLLLFLLVSISLTIFRVKDVVFGWTREFLSDGIKIGAVYISLGSVMIFVFVIWLSIMISRILRYVLEKDVFTRVKTAKGIPGTVILLLRIALISAGFFLAAAASGMKLTNLSIVLGAFSVGIGFGLQNIFNNMVSGLILAFERPINVGDVIQVGTLMGTVKSIGLRSSKIKSFDGAEVIVPNGNLISNEMINWTLADSYRRMDIRVGVAYGTDPERVLTLMEGIAVEHDQIRQKPLPKAYFMEFGDSSLNFRLLAWVHLDNRLTIESELNVLINKKLAEAGIVIPFPQHDLHIMSDHTKAKAATTKAKPTTTKAKPTTPRPKK